MRFRRNSSFRRASRVTCSLGTRCQNQVLCGRMDQKIARLKRLSLHNATLNRQIFKTFRSDRET